MGCARINGESKYTVTVDFKFTIFMAPKSIHLTNHGRLHEELILSI